MQGVVSVFGRFLRAATAIAPGVMIAGCAIVAAVGAARGQGTSNTCQPRWVRPDQSASGPVYAIEKLSDAQVIVGGSFTGWATSPARGLAMYEPRSGKSSAIPVGPVTGIFATPPTVYTLCASADGRMLVGGDLYPTSSGLSAGVGHLDLNPVAWRAVDLRSGRPAYASARLINGDIVMAGQLSASFPIVGSFKMARYNPQSSAWTPLGAAFSGSDILALSPLPTGELVVGGFAGVAPRVLSASSVALFAPATNTWTALGQLTGGPVRAITLAPNGDVIAGGSFTASNSGPLASVGRYSFQTGTWSSLGSGLTGTVYALAVRANGDIIAGGRFSSVPNSTNLDRNLAIKRAVDADWTLLDVSRSGSVYALKLISDAQLLVGGAFTMSLGTNFSAGTSFAQLSLCTCSIADIASVGGAPGGEGQLTTDDLIAFLSAFSGQSSLADIASRGGAIAPDGQFTADDVIVFLAAFFAGCP